jgi:hypothetical protein
MQSHGAAPCPFMCPHVVHFMVLSLPNLRYYSTICLEGLRQTMVNLNWHDQSPDHNFTAGSPHCDAGTLSMGIKTCATPRTLNL